MIDFRFTVPPIKRYTQMRNKNGLVYLFSNNEETASLLIPLIGTPVVLTPQGAEWIILENELENIPTEIFIEGANIHAKRN